MTTQLLVCANCKRASCLSEDWPCDERGRSVWIDRDYLLWRHKDGIEYEHPAYLAEAKRRETEDA